MIFHYDGETLKMFNTFSKKNKEKHPSTTIQKAPVTQRSWSFQGCQNMFENVFTNAHRSSDIQEVLLNAHELIYSIGFQTGTEEEKDIELEIKDEADELEQNKEEIEMDKLLPPQN